MIFLALTLWMLSAASVNAQVRIGGTTNPDPSAILDLNPDSISGIAQNATGGLLLPRVNLVDPMMPDPFTKHAKGLTVYNLTGGNGLNEGVYCNNGVEWFPVISCESMNTGTEPIIFLRQPGFLWLGVDGSLTDTLGFELATVDKSGFTYQWYKRDPVTLLSTAIEGATSDTIFINDYDSNRASYGIIDEGKVYQFYCVVVNGSQYGISGTGRVVYGTGARLANGGWIKVANANLGAEQDDLSLAEQIAYQPDADSSDEVEDKGYDPTVYGDWYQWGRKADGHENRKILAVNTVNTYLNSPNGVGTDSLYTDGQIQSDLSDIYGKFIQRGVSTSDDWRQYPEQNENFITAPANEWTWGNPANDPCKLLGSTWRVPTSIEWSQIVSNNTWVWQEGGANGTSGYLLKPGGANKPTVLFLPAAGGRNRGTGMHYNIGSYGRYWSSTPASTGSYYLGFNFGESITSTATSSRANGYSVRCVSERFN
ncbi:MAG: fibrobacter succinogenes major paralogous domain-containing protein [Dysgonamonadaceae bacterium]|nr:fibrobacter succinogenes major paralogous domain-containing protein [Dysgonamonadaceae bacterium]